MPDRLLDGQAERAADRQFFAEVFEALKNAVTG